MIKSLPLTALSLTLGFFFIFVGSLKITPKVNQDMYSDLKNEFGRYNRVFPLYKWTGWRPYAKNYRLTVGYTEIVCGLILILIPGRIKDLATLILTFIMLGGCLTHYLLKDKFERMAPALVFTLLLLCRLIISYQVERRERLSLQKEEELEKSSRVEEENEEINKEEEQEEQEKDVKKAAKSNKDNSKEKKSTKKNK